MHRPFLMATALTTGLWAAACSRPASQTDQNTSATAGARQIELVETPGAAGALASDLEARRAPRPAPSRAARLTTSATAAGEPNARLTHDHAVVVVAAAVPAVGTTASAMAETPLSLAAAPMPAPIPAVPAILVGPGFEAGGPSAGNDPDLQPGPVSRGPTIIIRGGMGSPHDDCKIHGQGGRGPGAAINRIAPSFSPGGGSGRSGGLSFPRGGIR